MAIVNGQYVPDSMAGSTNLSSMQNWTQAPISLPSTGTGVGADALNNPLVQQNLGYTQGITGLTDTNTQGGNWLSNLTGSAFDTKDATGNLQQGWLAPTVGAATGLAQSWLGFQNLGQAKDQLNFQRDAWNQQFNLQKEEYEYQKQRRAERQANYDASLGNQRNSAANATV